jgi:60kDa lysophospholipase
LTKLAYLLSKPELSVAEVRELMAIPLRGELTRVSKTAPTTNHETLNQNVDNIQQMLQRFVHLSSRPTTSSTAPQITLTSSEGDVISNPDPHNTAAPWSWTAAEAASTEAVLYPFLIHLAASRNDIETLKVYLGALGEADTKPGFGTSSDSVAGGMVNCLESASGRSPLHVAALNGHTDSVRFLLQSGALVHLRDVLGHTALYYVSP